MPVNDATVIDASNVILGRLASIVSKRLLNGEKIIIVNAEKAVISGNKKNIFEEAMKRLEIRTLGSKTKSPKHYRRPDGLVRKTIRGMLPWDKSKGKEAYRMLKVYIGIPKSLNDVVPQTFSEANLTNVRASLISVGDVAKSIGWDSS
jgi:large subunit ribosomal protein L13